MKHTLTLALVSTGVLMLTGVTLGQSSNGNRAVRQSFDQEYSELLQRNPFLRERHAPRPPRDRDAEQRMRDNLSRNRRNAYVLRGVAIEDDELHAYFEPSRGGEMRRLAPGDAFEDGRIVGIAIDAVAYEYNGQVQWIEIGQDLTGAKNAAMASASASSSSTDSTTQPSAKPADSSLPAEGGTLAERMRARARAQRGNRQ